MSKINFFCETIDYTLRHKRAIRSWIQETIVREGKELDELNIVFCSDDYLLEMNQQYLKHDYYTDIITFDHSESDQNITGELFISLDRIRENASTQGNPFTNELHRVMIHGVLHLIGYGDKEEEAIRTMREKEDACLSLLQI